jgi:hypothetical protein
MFKSKFSGWDEVIAVDFTRTAESVQKTGADLTKWARQQETKVCWNYTQFEAFMASKCSDIFLGAHPSQDRILETVTVSFTRDWCAEQCHCGFCIYVQVSQRNLLYWMHRYSCWFTEGLVPVLPLPVFVKFVSTFGSLFCAEHWCPSSRVYTVTSQETVIFIVTSRGASNRIPYEYVLVFYFLKL